ncbi:MAG: BrnA antitoxin family protein [Desulfobulbus sp.]|nr:BrnA antitoxin family protein [Desulfobulbus sp.]
MIPEKLKARMTRDRAMTSITLRVPVDVVDSLKAIAPLKGMSGYQALLKAYVSEGLRRDEAAHLFGPAARLAEALRRRGVPADLIAEAAQEAA